MKFEEVISEVETIAPPPLEGERAAQWIENTEKYGFPVYKYPFYFWEAEGEYTPKGAQPRKISCNPFLFPSSDDLYACSVWNDQRATKLDWTASTPVYMMAPDVLSYASRGFEIIEDEKKESVPMKVLDPLHAPTDDAIAEHQSAAAEKKAAMGWSILYATVGLVGAAILYKKYGK